MGNGKNIYISVWKGDLLLTPKLKYFTSGLMGR